MENRTAKAGLGNILFPIIRTLVIAYIAIVALAYFFQRRLLYFPYPEPAVIPAEQRYREIREVDLTAADGVPLKAWHWPGKLPITFLVFHGNAGHREHRLSWMERLRETGAGIFILDYRGYGGSGGSPSESGLYRDAEAAAEWLAAKAISPVVYVGQSLGAAVAVELALKRPPAAIILQSAFTSAVEVGKGAYPFLPVGLMLKDRYDSIDKIARVTCPVMVIHGGIDSMIPLAMGRSLFEAATGKKEWLEVAGADHNDPIWLLEADYVRRIASFLGI